MSTGLLQLAAFGCAAEKNSCPKGPIGMMKSFDVIVISVGIFWPTEITESHLKTKTGSSSFLDRISIQERWG